MTLGFDIVLLYLHTALSAIKAAGWRWDGCKGLFHRCLQISVFKSGGIYCQELCKLSDFSYISVYKFKIFFYIFIQNMFYRAHVKWFHVNSTMTISSAVAISPSALRVLISCHSLPRGFCRVAA